MTVFQRILRTLKRDGAKVAGLKVYIEFADRWFDFKYSTDTCGTKRLSELTIDSPNQTHGTRYEPARIVLLRKLLRELRAIIPPDSGLVDLGCGKGRVLLIAAQAGFQRAVGVEFARELSEIAQKNCAIFTRKSGLPANLEVIQADVVDYRIESGDNVFFMFNPFDRVILQKVLANIEASTKDSPRQVYICYYNPSFGEATESHSGFTKIIDLTHWGYRFKVFSNI